MRAVKKEILALHHRALEIASRFRKAEAELIDILEKMDSTKGFREFGYSSLFSYAVEELKLSESNAATYIMVSRKAKEIPELKREIQLGNMTVSKARRIVPVIKKENKAEWIEKAKVLPQRALEKEVAKVAPQILTPERTRYVTETRLELRLGVSEELLQMLKRAQDLVSQKLAKAVSFEETLTELLELYLEKKDPLQKAERVLNRENAINKSKENLECLDKGELTPAIPDSNKEDQEKIAPRPQKSGDRFSLDHIESHGTCHVESPKTESFQPLAPKINIQRVPIPAKIFHQVYRRDQGQCQFETKTGPCRQKRWVHLHHKTPVHLGGSNDVENLITLCASHHRAIHEESLRRN